MRVAIAKNCQYCQRIQNGSGLQIWIFWPSLAIFGNFHHGGESGDRVLPLPKIASIAKKSKLARLCKFGFFGNLWQSLVISMSARV